MRTSFRAIAVTESDIEGSTNVLVQGNLIGTEPRRHGRVAQRYRRLDRRWIDEQHDRRHDARDRQRHLRQHRRRRGDRGHGHVGQRRRGRLYRHRHHGHGGDCQRARASRSIPARQATRSAARPPRRATSSREIEVPASGLMAACRTWWKGTTSASIPPAPQRRKRPLWRGDHRSRHIVK